MWCSSFLLSCTLLSVVNSESLRCGRIGLTPLNVCVKSVNSSEITRCSDEEQYILLMYEGESCSGDPIEEIIFECPFYQTCICSSNVSCNYGIYREYHNNDGVCSGNYDEVALVLNVCENGYVSNNISVELTCSDNRISLVRCDDINDTNYTLPDYISQCNVECFISDTTTTTPSITKTSPPEMDNEDGIIIGSVIGTVFAIILCALCVWIVMERRNREHSGYENVNNQSFTK